MKYRDSCASNRPVADLLRWSMGSEPRYSKGYADYQAPKRPAFEPLSVDNSRLAVRLRNLARRAANVLRR